MREVSTEDAGSSVGAELRLARQRHGIDLRLVADELRIRHDHLQALEEGHFDELPGATYVYGFLRAYGNYLGLDSEELIRRFKSETGGLRQPPTLEFPAPAEEGRVPAAPLLLIALALAAAGYAGWYYVTTIDRVAVDRVPEVPARLVEQASAPPATAPGLPAPAATTAPEPASPPPAEAPAAEPAPAAAPTPDLAAVGETTPAAGTPAVTSAPAAAPVVATVPAASPPLAASPEPAAAPAPATTEPAAVTPPPLAHPPLASRPSAPPPSAASAIEAQPAASAAAPAAASAPLALTPAVTLPVVNPARRAKVVQRRLGTTPAAASPATATAAATEAPATPPPPTVAAGDYAPRVFGQGNANARIVIRAKEESWVQVTGRDNELLLTRILRPGDRYLVPDRPGLKLMTGNAGGLRVVVDGKAAPPLGKTGDVRRDVALDPDKLLAGTAVAP